MIEFKISLDLAYDEETKNITVTGVDGDLIQERKTKAVNASKKSFIFRIEDRNPGIIVGHNHIYLSPDAIDKLDVGVGERISITYEKIGSRFQPVIQKSYVDGNRLSVKSRLIYRGKSNEELRTFGNRFTLRPGRRLGTYYLMKYEESDNMDGNIEDLVNEELEELRSKISEGKSVMMPKEKQSDKIKIEINKAAETINETFDVDDFDFLK
jgi:hypothetical protein